ncbi:MAG: hypothetical protein ACRYFV_15665 [Janthinobacterium lividum]
MNYIKHTVAAHEHLRQQSAAGPQHIALYWALFFAWNAEFFNQEGLTLNHEQVMRAARIGSRHTYRAALRDLHTWGLISYKPSKVRGTVSTCSLQVLDGSVRPEVALQNRGSKAKSGPTEKAFVGPEVAQAVRPEVAAQTGFVRPEVAQHSLLVQTSFQTVVPNVGADTQKQIGERFTSEGLSEVQVLDNNRKTAPATAAYDKPGTAPGVAPKKKVAPKKMRLKHLAEGVGQEPLASTASPDEPRPPRRAPLPELPFSQSAIATPEAFVAAFQGSDYELADLCHYHQLVATWRDKKTGQEPLRRDWVATAKRFMLNDAADNRLKLAPNVQPHPTDPTPAGTGIPASGYRSSRWD